MTTTVTERIDSFTKLDAWKEAHRLTISIYKVTKQFPKEEMFGLTSQMRRCGVSGPSNIAEAFSRNFLKEKQQFFAIALGSMSELQSQLLIARDLGYLSPAEFAELAEQTVRVKKLIYGLSRSSKGRRDSKVDSRTTEVS